MWPTFFLVLCGVEFGLSNVIVLFVCVVCFSMNVFIMFGLNLLLCMICLVLLYSLSLSLSSSGYVGNLVVKYLMVAVICSGGWFESLGMMISLAVGLRYTLN